jgi:hypothetical protein
MRVLLTSFGIAVPTGFSPRAGYQRGLGLSPDLAHNREPEDRYPDVLAFRQSLMPFA